MPTIKQSKGGIDYLVRTLKQKAKTITKAILWRIPHNTPQDDVRLKIGRYNRIFKIETPETSKPKSALTLDNEEFQALLTFLEENYEPFKKGIRKYIQIDEKFDQHNIEHLKAIFSDPDKQKVLDFIAKNEILPEDLVSSLQYQVRVRAVQEFDSMLSSNLLEANWQGWFKKMIGF